ncbi:MAG: lysophospholipid acyltransferase family protein [Gemmatimonadaceae bacterium]|nr:lysophospholipid acyltransferase family protein [Gemmatimonadaceae bacterium]
MNEATEAATTAQAAAAARPSITAGRRALIVAGTILLRLLMWTWRIERRNMEQTTTARRAGHPVILAFWHGKMLGAMSAHRHSGIRVLVSEHKDGEVIARILEANGVRTIRGSTSRGGARALLQLVAAVKQGHTIAITPDGPRGPRHSVAPGLFAAAQRGGAPIVPMAVAASRVWQLGSWDGFEIPKPFARVVVQYGDPVEVPEGATREVDVSTARYVDALAAAQHAADAAARA